MLWEHKSEPLLTRRTFALRMGHQLTISLGIVMATVAIGTIGFILIGQFALVDAFAEAALLLSGAGTIHSEQYTSGTIKTFAAIYALFSTLVVISIVAFICAPVIHRVLHRLHLDKVNKK